MADMRWPHDVLRGFMETDARVAGLVHAITENSPDANSTTLGTQLIERVGGQFSGADAAAVGLEMRTFVARTAPPEPVVVMASSIEAGTPCPVCVGSMERDEEHDHVAVAIDADHGVCRLRDAQEWMMKCSGDCGTHAFAGGTTTALKGGTTTLEDGVLSRTFLRVSKATFVSVDLLRHWVDLQLRAQVSFQAIAQSFNDSAYRGSGGNETTAAVGHATRGRSATARVLNPKVVRDAVAMFLALTLNDHESTDALAAGRPDPVPLFDASTLYNLGGLDSMLGGGTPGLLRAIARIGHKHIRNDCPDINRPFCCMVADGGVKNHRAYGHARAHTPRARAPPPPLPPPPPTPPRPPPFP